MMKKLPENIKKISDSHKKEYAKVLKAIKKYERIAIFRHNAPDFDALGTQLGLATWINDNFPNKEIKVFGENHVAFTPRLFREMDKENENWFKQPFLAIIVDVGNTDRISDPRFKKAKYKIIIDHHPRQEDWGRVRITDTSMAAASELVVNMILSFKGDFKLSEKAAENFYIGLAGDSGNFKYSSVSPHTFEIACELSKTGIKISKIIQNMFLKKLDDLYVTSYILNHFTISDKGIAYYILDGKIQDELHITTEQGKDNVNLFANIEGINAWCSCTEDVEDHVWRVSIRSKEKAINGVAAMFRGGGHAQASGATLHKLEEMNLLVDELGKLF